MDRARCCRAIRLEDGALVPRGDPITYAQLGTAVREIAGGLAELGVERGDHVAILCSTRPEWTLADYGILAAGATVVPIYPTNSAEECAYVLGHSESVAVICEDAAQLAKIERVRGGCPALTTVVLIEGESAGTIPLGAAPSGRGAGGRRHRAPLAAVEPSDVATIVYTSGTTGPPKGCVTTHGNLRTTAAMYEHELELGGDLSMYLYLPLAHSLARIAQAVALQVGGTLALLGRRRQEDRRRGRASRADALPLVPRVYEKIHTAVLSGVAEQSRPQRAVFAWALEVGRRSAARRRSGRPMGRLDRVRHGAADRLVLSKVRGVFGGRLQLAMTGAAPIGREILEFFDACGVLILEGYGMSESCAAGTLNTPRAVRLGTVGRQLDGTEVSIAPDERARSAPRGSAARGLQRDRARRELPRTRARAASAARQPPRGVACARRPRRHGCARWRHRCRTACLAAHARGPG